MLSLCLGLASPPGQHGGRGQPISSAHILLCVYRRAARSGPQAVSELMPSPPRHLDKSSCSKFTLLWPLQARYHYIKLWAIYKKEINANCPTWGCGLQLQGNVFQLRGLDDVEMFEIAWLGSQRCGLSNHGCALTKMMVLLGSAL